MRGSTGHLPFSLRTYTNVLLPPYLGLSSRLRMQDIHPPSFSCLLPASAFFPSSSLSTPTQTRFSVPPSRNASKQTGPFFSFTPACAIPLDPRRRSLPCSLCVRRRETWRLVVVQGTYTTTVQVTRGRQEATTITAGRRRRMYCTDKPPPPAPPVGGSGKKGRRDPSCSCEDVFLLSCARTLLPALLPPFLFFSVSLSEVCLRLFHSEEGEGETSFEPSLRSLPSPQRRRRPIVSGHFNFHLDAPLLLLLFYLLSCTPGK